MFDDDVKIIALVMVGIVLLISVMCYFAYVENKADNEALIICVQETKQISECKLAIQGR